MRSSQSTKSKADRYKWRSRLGTIVVSSATASIPILIIASTETMPFVLGQLLPAPSGATAALVATVAGVEQPRERWVLYRRYQRQGEAERIRYIEKIGPYAGDDRKQLFAEWVATAKTSVHDEWSTLVPPSSDLNQQVTEQGGSEPALGVRPGTADFNAAVDTSDPGEPGPTLRP